MGCRHFFFRLRGTLGDSGGSGLKNQYEHFEKFHQNKSSISMSIGAHSIDDPDARQMNTR